MPNSDSSAGPVAIIGVDIGTTSTKAVAWDPEGRALGSHTAGYPLEEPSAGQAVQDPAKILAAVEEVITAVAAQARSQARIVGISFSAAMHSLIALDGEGQAITPVITWADTRASVQADRLRGGNGGLELHRRTGTPLHPMSPLPKLVWFREQEPKLFARARRWVGIKELVLDRLCGEMAVDYSVAAAMGLLNLDALEWDPEALTLAGVSADKLSPLVDTTHVLHLTRAAAQDLGLTEGLPVVVGSSDGPLANLGVGAVEPGVAACSIGTSGALRVMVEKPSVDPLGRVFCYPLTKNRFVVGGAINNGGVVLAWAGDALAPEFGDEPQEALLEAAAADPGRLRWAADAALPAQRASAVLVLAAARCLCRADPRAPTRAPRAGRIRRCLHAARPGAALDGGRGQYGPGGPRHRWLRAQRPVAPDAR